jgi:hypothetical protein
MLAAPDGAPEVGGDCADGAFGVALPAGEVPVEVEVEPDGLVDVEVDVDTDVTSPLFMAGGSKNGLWTRPGRLRPSAAGAETVIAESVLPAEVAGAGAVAG